jgi:hypothetical protein
MRVIGQKVTIHLVDDLEQAEDEPLAGHMDLMAGRLVVGGRQSEDQLADTLVHETLHFILQMVGHDSEELCWRTAPVLLQFLRDNPKWLEFVTGRSIGGRGQS